MVTVPTATAQYKGPEEIEKHRRGRTLFFPHNVTLLCQYQKFLFSIGKKKIVTEFY